MACFLGIDYGTKRIGMAVGDDHASIASPLKVIASTGRVNRDIQAILRCAEEYGAEAFVVGLPLNMDDTEGVQAKITRDFGDHLSSQSGFTVHFCDERLSSATASHLLTSSDLTRRKRKARVDSVAAQIILQTFFDSRAAESS